MNRLEGKVLIVAGGGSGIGAETALRMAREGAAVVIGDIDPSAAQRVAALIVETDGRALGVACDITDEVMVAAMVNTATREFGGLDGIHINAADMRAIMQDADALTLDLGVFDRTLAVNLRGHLLCTRAALPALLARGGGAIVYTSSGAADMGEPTRVSYAVSKSGLHALMRHVASRWGKEGIRANAIAPGLVITEQLKAHFPDELRQATLAITRSPRLGESADIAAMVAMLMSSDGEWINGQVVGVDGGAMLR